ncbi:MAG: kelch repeat-containing protein [Bacteroidota bacterium]
MKANFLKALALIYIFNLVFRNQLYSQDFTWMKGTTVQWGLTTGTVGAASPTNEIGYRTNPATWRDSAGDLWVYGGYGYYWSISDLWKYSVSNNTWAWVWNHPGTFPLDQAYGTLGTPSPSNSPGSRSGSASWSDNAGNLWMYGGAKNFPGTPVYNDLWKYDKIINQWTWMAGTTIPNEPGIYGTLGVPSAGNSPGARYLSASWKDANGDFWLFGGLTFENGNGVYKDDLWKYSVSTNMWTWIKGSNTGGQTAQYGTQGASSPANTPGCRTSPTCWTDPSQNFWLMGGVITTSSSANYLNDLWKYDPAANAWTWMSGSNTGNQVGNYGTLNVQSPGNVPGARSAGFGWYDIPSGNAYVFAGKGYAVNSASVGLLNDLWKYSPVNNQWTWVNGTNTINKPSVFGTQGVTSPTNMPATRSGVSGWIDNNNNFWLFGGNATHTTVVIGSGGPLTLTVVGGPADVWRYNNCAPTLSLSNASATLCPGNPVLITATGANSYTWSTSETTSSITVFPFNTTTYSITGTGANGCTAIANITQFVDPCIGIKELAELTVFAVYPNPNKGVFTLNVKSAAENLQFILMNALGQTVHQDKLSAPHTVVRPDLEKGLYFCQLLSANNEKTGAVKKVVIE